MINGEIYIYLAISYDKRLNYFLTSRLFWKKSNFYWKLEKITWAPTQENLSSGFANNKGSDQPAHLGRLISAFLILFLESIISKLASREISIF